MRNFLIVELMVTGLALYSCNGSKTNEQESGGGANSNAESPQTTMEGKPLPSTVAGTENKSNIEVNAKRDDKGVGKFTGVKVGSSIDAAMAVKGKALFQTSCTACHTTTDQKLVGPGLKGITKIRTPEWIMNMITDPVKMTHNDPVAEALLQEMNGVQMTNQNVGDEGAREIFEFLRQNDAQ